MSKPSTHRMSFRVFKIALPLVASAAGLGVYHVNSASAEDSPIATSQAPSVEVATLEPQSVRTWTRFSGRLSAVESASIKPLVSGTIQQVLFQEGQWIKPGDPLFIIDPRPHEAMLQRAQAQLATARSRARLAADELKRAERLVGEQLISQSLYDSAVNDREVADAAVLEAQSLLSQARLNLEYAHIRAPIGGRIGRAELTVGNVVEAGPNAPVLTTIVAGDRLYAEFNVNEQTYLRSVRNQAPADMPVELTLAADESVVYEGRIHAFDNHLDTTSGTIRARAVFGNTDGALTPGMYVNVRLGAPEQNDALLVPERAVGTNQDKKFVYVVDDNNTVAYRTVNLGESVQAHRIVLDGLSAGERIAVNSLSHLRPNTVVNPVPVTTMNQVAAH